MIATIVVFLYLAAVLFIGVFAFRKKASGEDFFLASRSIGSIVFFLSLFATNMTAFAILGSSGASYRQGIGIYGMMASSSGLVIPLTLFFLGTRLWAVGRRFGHMTQVQLFRDRWECSSIGTFIFLLTAAMLIPYLIISIEGGGQILEALTGGRIPFAVGGAILAIVVMFTVFFGGMRGAVWVNVFQTLLFLSFGTIAFVAIGHKINFTANVDAMAKTTPGTLILTRKMIPKPIFFSYLFIPLSSIMFPHMSIMCLTARKVSAFRKTVVLYPLCIMAIWLPCVYLGAIASNQPNVNATLAAGSKEISHWLEQPGSSAPPLAMQLRKATPAGAALVDDISHRQAPVSAGEFSQKLLTVVGGVKDPAVKGGLIKEVRRLAGTNSDGVLMQLLKFYVPAWLTGLLAAGILAAVMGSDCHQILGLSTMFSRDIFEYYGGRTRFGDRSTIFVGRAFIVLANTVAYLIALAKPPIFELAISYAFSGFASLAPVMVAALFWKRSTKYGALAAAIFVAVSVAGVGYLENHFAPAHPLAQGNVVLWSIGGHEALAISGKSLKLMVFGFMPVVPMVLISALCMVVGSLVTRRPSQSVIDRYFPPERVGEALAVAAG